MKLLRLAVVLVVSLAALLGTTSLASAAPAPRLTPQQVQSLCIAKKSIELLKAVDRQRWTDLRAKAAALRAIPDQAKAACPLGGTTPTPPVTPTPKPTGEFYTRSNGGAEDALVGEGDGLGVSCERTDARDDFGDRYVSREITGNTSIVTGEEPFRGHEGATGAPQMWNDGYTIYFRNETGERQPLKLTITCEKMR